MKSTIVVLVALVITTAVVVLIGNDYRIEERQVRIPAASGELSGVLAMPVDAPARGLVVMVHGDGEVTATHDGLYRPWFEAAADAGFATLSWSKPADWLAQSMADRAAEASAAIDWAHGQPGVPRDRLVLWGASQAGWVLPKIALARADVTSVVAVGPAVNWLRQGRFHLLAELEHQGASPEERTRATAVSDQTRRLLAEGVDHAAYLAATADPEPMSAARWEFVRRNHSADATEELRALGERRVPVLLMLGEQDRNVDTAETASTYQRLLGERVSIRRFAAAHSMAKPALDSGLLGTVVAVCWPRALFADGVLKTYRNHFEGLLAANSGNR